MENTNNFVWRFNTLSGFRIFIPGVVEPEFCGFMEDGPMPDGSDTVSEDEGIDEDLQFAEEQFEQERKKDIDQPFVREDLNITYPSTKADRKNYPAIPLQKELNRVSQQDFKARFQMFEAAFKTNEIFTISVKPKDPAIFQLWYQRQIVSKPKNHEDLGEYTKESSSKTTQVPETEDSKPEKQMGFLKPFDTFSSAIYRSDPAFEKMDSETIESADDIPTLIQDIETPDLKERLTEILCLFLQDEHSESMGIVFRQNSTPYIKLFQKA